jgi:hypothetical protein
MILETGHLLVVLHHLRLEPFECFEADDERYWDHRVEEQEEREVGYDSHHLGRLLRRALVDVAVNFVAGIGLAQEIPC